MSPTNRWSQLHIRRVDTASTQTRTDNAGSQPTPVRLVLDTAAPATPTFVLDAATELVTHNGMSNTMKVGLAMIPVAVVLAGLYILFLVWYRKRQAARKQLRLGSPSIPDKDLSSFSNSSIASKRRSSKVLSMSAFSTPVDEPHSKIQPFGQDAARNPAPRQSTLPKIEERRVGLTTPWSPPIFDNHPRTPPLTKARDNVQINMTAARSCPNITEANLDSPIDGSSPFRLKRGDTVKRCSLGPDLFRLWPTPPTSVWINAASVYDYMYDEGPRLNIRRQESTYPQLSSRFSE